MTPTESMEEHGIGARWVLVFFKLGPLLPRYGHSKKQAIGRSRLPLILLFCLEDSRFPDPISIGSRRFLCL